MTGQVSLISLLKGILAQLQGSASQGNSKSNISQIGGVAVPATADDVSQTNPVLPVTLTSYNGGANWDNVSAGSYINNGRGTLDVSAIQFLGDPTALNFRNAVVVSPGVGIAATPYSGTKTAPITAAGSTTVKGSAGCVGTLINTGDVTSPVITIWDGTTATGTQLFNGALPAGGTIGSVVPIGLPALVGITVELAAAGTVTLSYS